MEKRPSEVGCIYIVFEADPGWSAANRRQGGVWENVGGGAL